MPKTTDSVAYHQQYYQNHRDKWEQSRNTILHCDACDRDFKRNHYLRHTRSSKHKRNQTALEDTTVNISLKDLQTAIQRLSRPKE